MKINCWIQEPISHLVFFVKKLQFFNVLNNIFNLWKLLKLDELIMNSVNKIWMYIFLIYKILLNQWRTFKFSVFFWIYEQLLTFKNSFLNIGIIFNHRINFKNSFWMYELFWMLWTMFEFLNIFFVIINNFFIYKTIFETLEYFLESKDNF